MNEYRDPLAGLRTQIAAKKAIVEERGRKLSPIARALLPEPLRLADLDVLLAREAEDHAALTELDAALEDLLTRSERAIELAPRASACPTVVPDFPVPEPPPPWLIEELPQRAFRDHVEQGVRAIAADAVVVRWGDHGYLARLHAGGAPLLFQIQGHLDPNNNLIRSYTVTLRTSVPLGLGALEVRTERAHHAIGRALRLASELTVGDGPFDDAFWIKGDPVTATALEPEVRDALRCLAPSSPVLTVTAGLAELRWYCSHALEWLSVDPSAWESVLPRPAVDVLLGIRAAIERA